MTLRSSPVHTEQVFNATGNSGVANDRAGDRARTGDNQLGRLKLYQLSYSRLFTIRYYSFVGRAGFEPTKVAQQSYSLSSLTA